MPQVRLDCVAIIETTGGRFRRKVLQLPIILETHTATTAVLPNDIPVFLEYNVEC